MSTRLTDEELQRATPSGCVCPDTEPRYCPICADRMEDTHRAASVMLAALGGLLSSYEEMNAPITDHAGWPARRPQLEAREADAISAARAAIAAARAAGITP